MAECQKNTAEPRFDAGEMPDDYWERSGTKPQEREWFSWWGRVGWFSLLRPREKMVLVGEGCILREGDLRVRAGKKRC